MPQLSVAIVSWRGQWVETMERIVTEAEAPGARFAEGKATGLKVFRDSESPHARLERDDVW